MMTNTHQMTFVDSKFKDETCVSDGKYCVTGNKILRVPFWKRSESKEVEYSKEKKGPNGATLLVEDLRQKCLVQTLKENHSENVASLYFSYLSNFLE